MQSQVECERVATDLLATKGLRLVSCRTLQSLWAGYGHVCHISAETTTPQDPSPQQTSFILKYVAPPPARSQGPAPDEGHLRKLLSYQAELAFYTHLAPHLPPAIAVATCHASSLSLSSSSSSSSTTTTTTASAEKGAADAVEFRLAMLLTDLRPAFPVAGAKRVALTETQIRAALQWLAGFHGFWWRRVGGDDDDDNDDQPEGREGDGLFDRSKLLRPPLQQHDRAHGDAGRGDGPARVWLNGGYTYLATRRGEYARLCGGAAGAASEWAAALCRPVTGLGLSVAELVARVLAPQAQRGGGEPPPAGLAAYETLLHGDVKSENLFANAAGDRVAFYDFQYVGLGLGVCDLAKLFTCSVPRALLGPARRGQRVAMGEGEEALLRVYWDCLQRASGKSYPWDRFVRHWETALVDWLRFQASWGFWGNTAWLEGRVRFILADPEWVDWLREAHLGTTA